VEIPSKSLKSSVVLDKLQELSAKLEQLKYSESRSRRTTVFNVPKKNDVKKKNKISWGDEDWSLILYMMLGIQKSVKANLVDGFNVISEEDFMKIDKYDLKQSEKTTKSHEKTSKFRDFAPLVFANIRKMCDVTELSYLESLGVENIMESMMKCEFSSLIGLISSGKSGSFFYFSDNGKYVLKTLSSDEYKFFKKILPDYYNYLNENPFSLIPRIFGFHNINYASKRKNLKKSFIVMENLFSSGLEVHLRFDLKGSTVGRTTDPNEDFSVARKDLDFNRGGLKIKLSKATREKLLTQISKDSSFFERLGIIDYSLLLGVHNLKGSKIDMTDIDHAYLSSDGQCIYFIGIIDVLTQYNIKKKLENIFKLPIYGNDISCIPPKPYSERFLNYMESIFE
jgi:1-phosphatidylinositol-4-phosphate 5-kinase